MSKKQKYGSHESLSHPTLSYYTTPRPQRRRWRVIRANTRMRCWVVVPELPPMRTLNFQNPWYLFNLILILFKSRAQ